VRALVTNDDGIDSPGLLALARSAEAAGLDVLVAAPSWDSSGASASLTGVQRDGRLTTSLRKLPGIADRAWAVDAAPAMITTVALSGGFGEPPELVLSGINRGRNTGHAVLHSGTVGAALTAFHHGVCALAASVDAAEPDHWDDASDVAAAVIDWMRRERPPATLNLNIPDVPVASLAGLQAAPLAAVGAVQTNVTEVGEGYVQMTFDPVPESPRPGTDAALLAEGWAVVTAIEPLQGAGQVDLSGLAEEWSQVAAGR
jgi:5'-nucleotidase